jgi:ornithine carbamoyltransferase
MSNNRHFLTLLDFSPAQLQGILDRAAELKALRRADKQTPTLAGKVLGMIF